MRAQKQLHIKHIRHTHLAITVLKVKEEELCREQAKWWPENTHCQVEEFLNNAQLDQYRKSKERQIDKFYLLLSWTGGTADPGQQKGHPGPEEGLPLESKNKGFVKNMMSLFTIFQV